MRDINKLKRISKELIEEIGEDPNRTGLKDTPKRMAKFFNEVFRGYDPAQMPEVTVFPNNDDGIAYNQIITDTGRFSSFCEHHMALFQGTYYFGYIPDQTIVGLSKIARLVDYFGARMQIQERLGANVVNFLEKKLKPKGMILVLKGRHSCKEIRGAKKRGEMTTSIVSGLFETDIATRQEFFNLIK